MRFDAMSQKTQRRKHGFKFAEKSSRCTRAPPTFLRNCLQGDMSGRRFFRPRDGPVRSRKHTDDTDGQIGWEIINSTPSAHSHDPPYFERRSKQTHVAGLCFPMSAADRTNTICTIYHTTTRPAYTHTSQIEVRNWARMASSVTTGSAVPVCSCGCCGY